MELKKVFLAVFFLLPFVNAFAEVIVYPKVSELPFSGQYKITISQNGRTTESVVYVSDAQFEKNKANCER